MSIIIKPVYQTAAGWVKQFPDGSVSKPFALKSDAEAATPEAKKMKAAPAPSPSISEDEAEEVSIASKEPVLEFKTGKKGK